MKKERREREKNESKSRPVSEVLTQSKTKEKGVGVRAGSVLWELLKEELNIQG